MRTRKQIEDALDPGPGVYPSGYLNMLPIARVLAELLLDVRDHLADIRGRLPEPHY